MSSIEPRIAYYKLAPDGIKHLQALERYLADCGLVRDGDSNFGDTRAR